MKRFFNPVIIMVLLFLLSSCSSDFNYRKAYENQQYVEIISRSNEELESSIESDTVYYRFLSYYKLGEYTSASKSAELYAILESGSFDDKLHEALRLILFYSDTEAAIKAGRVLRNQFDMTISEKTTLFQLMMEMESYDEATAYYNEIRGELSGREAAEMLIASKASSVLIVSNLEAWYSESGQDSKLVDAVISTISLLNTRGEGDLILPLALSLDRSNTPRLSLAIGDLYYSLGYPQRARVYWSEAREAFPSLVERKFSALSS